MEQHGYHEWLILPKYFEALKIIFFIRNTIIFTPHIDTYFLPVTCVMQFCQWTHCGAYMHTKTPGIIVDLGRVLLPVSAKLVPEPMPT